MALDHRRSHTCTHTRSYGNSIHNAFACILVEVLSVRVIGNLLFMDTGGSSEQVWFIASSFSCQSSFSVLASSVIGGLTGQSSLTFFSTNVAGAKILALGLYSGDSMTASVAIHTDCRENYTYRIKKTNSILLSPLPISIL